MKTGVIARQHATTTSRRLFLKQTAGAVLLAAAPSWLPGAPAKAPFRLLYSNDTTNLETCVSPYHRKGENFRPAILEASIDEAAAADAQFLQPGLMWVPLWLSKIYPAAEHFRWWEKTFGRTPRGLGEYMVNGGDVVKVFVERCRLRKVAPFISVRVNDYHGLEAIDAQPGDKLSDFDALAMDRFRREHREYRLGAAAEKSSGVADKATFEVRDARVLNWAIPAVRERLLGFVTELCENYALGGLELDFLRHFRLFRLDETTPEQRKKIVTEFVAQVRAVLDRTAKGNEHRWLCVRVPAVPEAHDPLGIDLRAMAAAGVQMFNFSSNYYTVQQDIDFAAFRQALPGASLYLELTHCTVVGADPTRGRGDSNYYRRTTAEQYYTSTHLACARGLDGVSLFNFAYYREYGNRPERGPFNEPPFEVMPRLKERAFLASAPQHYFIAPVWKSPYGNKLQLPRGFKAGSKVTFQFDLAAPAGGWQKGGKVRLQTSQPMGACRWEARLNGTALPALADAGEPYPNPYPPCLGTAETLRAWAVRPEALKEGKNSFELTFVEGKTQTVVFVDLAAC